MTRGLAFIATILFCVACKSSKKQRPPKIENYEINAVDARVELAHEVIPSDGIELPNIETIIPGGILNNPPQTLVDVKGLPAMAELFGPLGWGATTKFASQGILKELEQNDGVPRVYQLVMRLVLDYTEVEMLNLDYPQLVPAMIADLPRTEEGLLRFTPITVRFYILPSDDKTAIRIVLDSLVVHEATESIRRRGDTADKPLPVLTTVTYHYPDPKEHTIRFATVIFDHKFVAKDGVFVGHRQISPWIPLQQNPRTAPFNFRIRVNEVTSRPWLDKFTDDISKMVAPVMRTYRGVR